MRTNHNGRRRRANTINILSRNGDKNRIDYGNFLLYYYQKISATTIGSLAGKHLHRRRARRSTNASTAERKARARRRTVEANKS